MKKQHIIIAIIFLIILVAAFLFRGTSSPEVVTVISDDGRVSLLIPLDAIPEGVIREEISVTNISKGNELSYDLAPDGLQFNNNISFQLEVPLASNAIPIPFHITSEGDIELVDNAEITIDLEENRATVVALISHFSKMTFGGALTDVLYAKNLFSVEASVSDTPVGQSVSGKYVVSKTGTIINNSSGKFKWTIELNSATLSGTLFEGRDSGGVLSPATIKNSPPSTAFRGDKFTTPLSGFTCAKEGTTFIKYLMKMNFTHILEFEGSRPHAPADDNVTISVLSPQFKCTEAPSAEETNQTSVQSGSGKRISSMDPMKFECPDADLLSPRDGGVLVEVVKLKDWLCYPAHQFKNPIKPDDCKEVHYHLKLRSLGGTIRPDKDPCGAAVQSDIIKQGGGIYIEPTQQKEIETFELGRALGE